MTLRVPSHYGVFTSYHTCIWYVLVGPQTQTRARRAHAYGNAYACVACVWPPADAVNRHRSMHARWLVLTMLPLSQGADQHVMLIRQIVRPELVVPSVVPAVASALATPILEAGFLDEDDVVERSWLFLTVVMESMFATRFLYLNQNDLMYRYPDIDRGMRRLMSLKRQMARQLASALLGSVKIHAHPQRLDQVSDSMAMTLMFWLNFEQLMEASQKPQQVIHRAVLQVLSHCAPYLGDKQADFYAECELINARLLDDRPS